MDMDITGSDPFSIQNDFWYYATGTSGVLEQLTPDDYELDNLSENQDYLTESFTAFKDNTSETGTLKINYRIPKSQNVYVYFDSSDVDEIDVFTQSESFSKTQNIDEPYILDCGYLEADEILTIQVQLDDETESCTAEYYVYGLDQEILDIGYDILNLGTMKIDTFEETHIKGTVSAAENKMLYTSINYDDGWTVMVDGKEAKKEKNEKKD